MHAPLLRGRDDQLAILEQAWAAAQAGKGTVLVVVGDPAIGRTALLEELLRRVGAPAAWTHGAGADSACPLALILDLTEALFGLLGGDEPGSTSVGEAVDPFAASELLGDLLERVDGDGPAVVVIEDLHDADPASRVALNLCLRRLRRSQLLVIVSGRPTDAVRSFAEGFRLVELAPLGRSDAVAILEASSPGPIAPSVLERLIDHAAGNPLALSQLPVLLSADQLNGSDVLPDPLPVVGELRDAFIRPLAQLGPGARELVELAAVNAHGSWATLTQIAGFPLDTALAELEAAGVARLSQGRLMFSHPLLRDAALANMSDVRRRELHHVWSMVDALGAHERIRHRAAAAIGPDESLVDELVRCAAELRGRGGSEEAAALLDRAAALTVDDERRCELRSGAADALARSGHSFAAVKLLDQVDAESGGSHQQKIRAQMCRAWVEALNGAPLHSWQRLQDCLLDSEGLVRASVHAAMSVPLGMLGLVREIEVQARAAIDLAEPGSVPSQVARVVHRHALVSLNEAEGSEQVVDLVEQVDLAAAVECDPLFGLHVGRLLAMSEQFTAAESALIELRARSRGENARVSLAMTMGSLGDVWVRSCRYDTAYAVLDEAIALSLASGQRAFAPFWMALRARVSSLRGGRADAESDLERGFAIADELVLPGARYFLLAAAGFHALTFGDLDMAIETLEECRAFEDAGGALAPNVGRWRPDLAEAYCAIGDISAARTAAQPVFDAARVGSGRWTAATAARVAGVIAAADEPERASRDLREAARMYDPSADAFDRSRALLACVVASRRAGLSPTDYSDAATDARMGFRSLGATQWESQLDASGTAIAPDSDGFTELTGAESAVLEQLANGATNRQIARTLGISPKTVANHLWRVYQKLGVTTRTEAVHRFLTR